MIYRFVTAGYNTWGETYHAEYKNENQNSRWRKVKGGPKNWANAYSDLQLYAMKHHGGLIDNKFVGTF